MLPVNEQIAQGRLVCPLTHRRLVVRGAWVESDDGAHAYPYRDGVPYLLPGGGHATPGSAAEGSGDPDPGELDGAMIREYRRTALRGWRSAWSRWLAARPDHRAPAAAAAFESVVASRGDDELCLGVGGGPRRVHPRLSNLNLDAFANVDVVGDAHRLPYAEGSVDAVHCEAVLEHLERPELAVAEMQRVLRPGGEVFAATPFLQAFHGYPSHYQNYTREGHDGLFRRHGFEILASGACVGPTFAITDLVAFWLRHYLPGRRLGRLVAAAVVVAALPVRRLDRRLLRRGDAHLMASTVFTHARKPGP